jgi:hypothetical protein
LRDDVNGSAAIALHLDDGTTEYALNHRFRPIKKDAQAMRAGTLLCCTPPCFSHSFNAYQILIFKLRKVSKYLRFPAVSLRLVSFSLPRPAIKSLNSLRRSIANFFEAVAEKFGQGATGKAISTRFERAKKETAWDLSINREVENGSAARSTPRSRKAKVTPKKAMDSNSDDEESNFGETPSEKKTPLNKVQGARVQKVQNGGGRGRKTGPVNYVELEDEDFEEIKGEQECEDEGHYPVNGNGYGGHDQMEFTDAFGGGDGHEIYYDNDNGEA